MHYRKLKSFRINFGPQHPAAHGVLRLILELNGEVINAADAHIGLLHRGTEKLMEYKTIPQILPYMDRLDYVSMLAQEHCLCLSLEKLLNQSIPLRAQIIRIIFLELTRILNHLLAITTHALDIGAFTPFLWAFEEREKIMEFYERVSGARMHANYIRVGGLAWDLPFGFLDDLYLFTLQFNSRLNEIEELLTFNPIWKMRLKNIGIVTLKIVQQFAYTGVLYRSSGIGFDIRKIEPYEQYRGMLFNIPIPFGFSSDCFDRYLLRLEEMRQSLCLIGKSLQILPRGKIKNDTCNVFVLTKNFVKSNMEQLISHFKFYTEGYILPPTCNYTAIEAPKGELGLFLISANLNRLHRCKVRSPGFYHLQGLHVLGYNNFLADIVAIIGTQDIVFGEIDR